MARTLKKRTAEKMAVSKYFRVGIYARLSVDGTERKNESIDTQIAIVKQYLKEHPEMEIYDCYQDLGKTGTHFKREGFECMMQDVRKKRINCVIVKDLSRFGRNHIETGNYIQKIFPFMGVRFIAITDGIDTFQRRSGADEITVNLKNLVNEMYANDIAEKVRSSRRSSQEQGSYTGGIPPYGYQAQWIDGKRCLVICPETSWIVKDIYDMYLSGINRGQIARKLYQREIHRPGIYKKTGHVYRQEGECLEPWTPQTVKLILTNPVYMGCLVQGTACKKPYNIRNRYDMDSGDYHVRQRTHEALVSEDIFFQAASIFEKSAKQYGNRNGLSKKVPLEEDIYASVVFCGNCKRKMVRTANAKQSSSGKRIRWYGYYCLASRGADERGCLSKSIGKSTLDELVKTALHKEFALSDLRPGRLIKECEKQTEGQKQFLIQEMIRYKKQQDNRKQRGSELYLQYRSGSLSLEEFQHRKQENEECMQGLSERIKELQHRLDGMERVLQETAKFLRTLIKCNEKTELTKNVISALISRIDIYADRRVHITFAFCRNDLLFKNASGVLVAGCASCLCTTCLCTTSSFAHPCNPTEIKGGGNDAENETR